MKKLVVVTVLCVAVLVLGALVVFRSGSNGPSQALIDEGRAQSLALDFYRQHQAPADSLSSVRVVSADQITGSSDGRVWEVRVTGGVTEPGSSITYESAMVLDVDVGTGTVTLVAEG